MYAEYVGLTPEVVALIEHLRLSPNESKSEILERVLAPVVADLDNDPTILVKIGNGVTLRVGERPVLFLTDDAVDANKPDAVAVVRRDGLYVDGRRITLPEASLLQGAMELVQIRKNHRTDNGELVSLNAWRQWHVIRYGRLVSLLEIKEAASSRDRVPVVSDVAIADAGLE